MHVLICICTRHFTITDDSAEHMNGEKKNTNHHELNEPSSSSRLLFLHFDVHLLRVSCHFKRLNQFTNKPRRSSSFVFQMVIFYIYPIQYVLFIAVFWNILEKNVCVAGRENKKFCRINKGRVKTWYTQFHV